jgi:hypothetical protein
MVALADAIRAARAEKPVIALVNDIAASAAYGIAAQANEVVISPTSVVGSIGVVLLHMDFSRELEKKGRKPTFIYAGAHKVDGNFLEPLSESVRADLQAEVDQYRRLRSAVAAGRGKLTEAAGQGNRSKIYLGAGARIRACGSCRQLCRRARNPFAQTNRRSSHGANQTNDHAGASRLGSRRRPRRRTAPRPRAGRRRGARTFPGDPDLRGRCRPAAACGHVGARQDRDRGRAGAIAEPAGEQAGRAPAAGRTHAAEPARAGPDIGETDQGRDRRSWQRSMSRNGARYAQ